MTYLYGKSGFNVFTIWPPSRRRLPADWLPSAGQPFATEKKRLLEALDRFVETHEQDPRRTAVHTTLGPLTLQAWSHIHAVHFNHHFRQFRLLRGPEVLEYWRWILIPVLAVVAWFLLR